MLIRRIQNKYESDHDSFAIETREAGILKDF